MTSTLKKRTFWIAAVVAVLLFLFLGPGMLKAYAKYVLTVEADKTITVSFNEYPTLSEKDSWYKGPDRNTVKAIHFVQNLPENVTADAEWNAADKETVPVKCVLSGADLYISSEGASRIIANRNSQKLFMGFPNMESVTGLGMLDTSETIDLSYMFEGCESLKSIDVSALKTQNTKTLYRMFGNCTELTSVTGFNSETWDTSNVKNFGGMFYNCSHLASVNLEGLETTSATSLRSMFYRCSALYAVSGFNSDSWDTSNVEDMTDMFFGCKNLIDIDVGAFRTAKVISMAQMFYGCTELQNIMGLSAWDISSVQYMTSMFGHCRNLSSLNFSNWTFEDLAKTDSQNMLLRTGENREDFYIECMDETVKDWIVSNTGWNGTGEIRITA